MKSIDVSIPLCDIHGQPLKDTSGKSLTVRWALCEALLTPIDGDKPSGEEKAKRYNLAMRINAASGQVEFPIEELAIIKDLVGRGFNAIVSGQVWKILEAV